jgi:hypothetical protein
LKQKTDTGLRFDLFSVVETFQQPVSDATKRSLDVAQNPVNLSILNSIIGLCWWDLAAFPVLKAGRTIV